jgi:hypothetical protein
MGKLSEHFDELLKRIEPDSDAVKYAKAAHVPIREHLETDKSFSEFFVNSFLYGSYARDTAIEDIKDVDIVVLTNFDSTKEENLPSEVLRILKESLNKYYEDDNSTEYQRKSIKVKDPLPEKQDVFMTLDVIPAIAVNGEDKPLLVPDIETNKWVFTHPKGHMINASTINKNSNERYIPLVKIIKHWWKYNNIAKQGKPKGFWLEIAVSHYTDLSLTCYADLFINFLENIWNEYQLSKNIPELSDPGLVGKNIKTSMTLYQYNLFIEEVHNTLHIAKRALEAEDTIESARLWSTIFGDQYFPYTKTKASTLGPSINTKATGLWGNT